LAPNSRLRERAKALYALANAPKCASKVAALAVFLSLGEEARRGKRRAKTDVTGNAEAGKAFPFHSRFVPFVSPFRLRRRFLLSLRLTCARVCLLGSEQTGEGGGGSMQRFALSPFSVLLAGCSALDCRSDSRGRKIAREIFVKNYASPFTRQRVD